MYKLAEYQNKFKDPQTNDPSNSNMWHHIENNIIETCKTTLGLAPKNKHKQWLNEECGKIIEQKNKARIRMLQDPSEDSLSHYKHLRTMSRKIIRKSKRKAAGNSK